MGAAWRELAVPVVRTSRHRVRPPAGPHAPLANWRGISARLAAGPINRHDRGGRSLPGNAHCSNWEPGRSWICPCRGSRAGTDGNCTGSISDSTGPWSLPESIRHHRTRESWPSARVSSLWVGDAGGLKPCRPERRDQKDDDEWNRQRQSPSEGCSSPDLEKSTNALENTISSVPNSAVVGGRR